MIKAGDQVVVATPEPNHAHMKGARGRVQSIRFDKHSRRRIVAVNFTGGVGVFRADELASEEG